MHGGILYVRTEPHCFNVFSLTIIYTKVVLIELYKHIRVLDKMEHITFKDVQDVEQVTFFSTFIFLLVYIDQ